MSLSVAIASIVCLELLFAVTAAKLKFGMLFFHVNVHSTLCVNSFIANRTDNFFNFLFPLRNCMFLNLELALFRFNFLLW